jgi:hypothetical protein
MEHSKNRISELEDKIEELKHPVKDKEKSKYIWNM